MQFVTYDSWILDTDLTLQIWISLINLILQVEMSLLYTYMGIRQKKLKLPVTMKFTQSTHRKTTPHNFWMI